MGEKEGFVELFLNEEKNFFFIRLTFLPFDHSLARSIDNDST